MENDQVPATPNTAANHANKIVETVRPNKETSPTSVPATMSFPTATPTEVSAANVSVVSSGVVSTAAATRNEEMNPQKQSSTEGESSTSSLPSQSRPLSAFATASRHDFLPPASQFPNDPQASSRTPGASNNSSVKHNNISPTLSKAPPPSMLLATSSFPRA
jgi:hypothetical protein